MVVKCFLSEERIWNPTKIEMFKTYTGKLVSVNKEFIEKIKEDAEFNIEFTEKLFERLQYLLFENYIYEEVELIIDKYSVLNKILEGQFEHIYGIVFSHQLYDKNDLQSFFLYYFVAKNYPKKINKKIEEISIEMLSSFGFTFNSLVEKFNNHEFEEVDSVFLDTNLEYLENVHYILTLINSINVGIEYKKLIEKHNNFKVHIKKNKFQTKKRNNFEKKVNEKKKLKTNSGIYVQSNGEKLIADFLYNNNIAFDYDEQITLKGNEINENGYDTSWCRPDFYLNEFDIIIEYWGLKGKDDYDESMSKKKRLYKEAGKKFIEITPKEIKSIDDFLYKKLNLLGIHVIKPKPNLEKNFKCKICGKPIKKIGNGNCFSCNLKAKKRRNNQK